MNILIDNRSGAPIYEQIFDQIRLQILDDTLKEDEALPSIRNLAKDLRISVITTKRAYDELEAAGFLYTVPGKGSFFSKKNAEMIREEHLLELEEHLEEVRKLAKLCQLSSEDVWKLYNVLEDNHERD